MKRFPAGAFPNRASGRFAISVQAPYLQTARRPRRIPACDFIDFTRDGTRRRRDRPNAAPALPAQATSIQVDCKRMAKAKCVLGQTNGEESKKKTES
jgi:hypothetical protein